MASAPAHFRDKEDASDELLKALPLPALLGEGGDGVACRAEPLTKLHPQAVQPQGRLATIQLCIGQRGFAGTRPCGAAVGTPRESGRVRYGQGLLVMDVPGKTFGCADIFSYSGDTGLVSMAGASHLLETERPFQRYGNRSDTAFRLLVTQACSRARGVAGASTVAGSAL